MAMPRVQAWERLNDSEYCGRLTMVQFRDLLLEAGYSQEAVRKAANQRGWDRLCAGVTM
jgi:hypothetical protein